RLERVRRDEQPDRLLLDRQQLGLVELLARDRRMHRPREARGGCGARPVRRAVPAFCQVEDRTLADLRILLDLLARALRLLEHGEHALAARAGRTERAALDQGLDRLLVDGAVVDALAEVPQRGELAALPSPPFDRLNRLIADALDRVQAEADV